MASKYLKRTTAKFQQNWRIFNCCIQSTINNLFSNPLVILFSALGNKNLHEKTNMVGEKEPYIRCKSKLLFFIENIS